MVLKKFYLGDMKIKFSLQILFLWLLVFNFTESKASTLLDSLKSAYINNPRLNAERANMRASKEDTRGSISEFLPSVTISGYVSDLENTEGNESNFKPSEHSVKVEQKIFQGGGGVASFMKKKYSQTSGEFKLKKTEQEILLEAVKAHVDLILNKKKLNFNLMNVELLERQVETDQNRLEKGEISLTDLAQSESSLAGATAKLISAQNKLVTSKANFEKIIGNRNFENIQEINEINLNLPKSLALSNKIASTENPDLQIAILEFKKAKKDVEIAAADLLPSASLSYELAEQNDMSATVQDRTKQTVTATAKWPLFSGGSNIFNYRKVGELKNQKELLLQDGKKKNKTDVANAWSNYQSSKSVLDSIRSQVKAAEIANEGIFLEYESGNNRTTLEVIQSRSILLNSRIDLATSERDFLISQFNLLSAVGRLTAGHLNLK